jgi:hypothetical protein
VKGGGWVEGGLRVEGGGWRVEGGGGGSLSGGRHLHASSTVWTQLIEFKKVL